MAAVTCWHRLYGKEWCGSKRATAIASCFHQSAEFQVEVCFMFGFVCLFVSGLGTLVWSYGFPLNIHEKFSRVSPRCKHKGSNVWTFSLCSTSLFLLVWAVLAAFWHMAENFFFLLFSPEVLASITTDYWPVTTHRAEDVLQQEEYKNSKAAPGKA